MSSLELPSRQRVVLWTLVNCYRGRDEPVKAKEIGSRLDRTPGTVRNQMTSLLELDLVETEVGHEGGYRPTDATDAALGIDRREDIATTPLVHEGERREHAIVTGIDLTGVANPQPGHACISLLGDIHSIDPGDEVRVGPTPTAALVVEGTVELTRPAENQLVVRVTRVDAPA